MGMNAEIANFYEQGPMSGGAPQQVVILLHGVGSNGQDLISLAPVWAKDLPDAVFVSPDAPFACDMVPAGYPNSYQWFSLQNRDPHVMGEGVKAAQPLLDKFINDTYRKYNLSAKDTALVGFSQGTMMSLYCAPRYDEALAGVLGYSGALIGGEGLSEDAENIHKIPLHLVHGEADDVVPIEAYRQAITELEAAGFDVSGHSTPGLTHSIDQAGLDSGGAFLKTLFG